MESSLIYRSALTYETLMRVLYGRAYGDRYQAIADLIRHGSSVVDLCCGPATLFHRYLRQKNVQYTGIDLNRRFIERLRSCGATGIICNLDGDVPLPPAEYVLIQASLYHFLPDASPLIERMCAAARKQVLIAEPIRNVADSRFVPLAFLARKFTNPGTRDQLNRFNEARLDALFDPYLRRGQVVSSALIAGGREKLYVLRPTSATQCAPAANHAANTGRHK